MTDRQDAVDARPGSDFSSRRLLRRGMPGLLLVLFAFAVWMETHNLDFGTLARMGPAFFPVVVAAILFLLGVGIMVFDLVAAPGGEAEADERVPWLAILIVTGALCGFGLVLQRLGLFLSGFLLIVVTSLASPATRLLELLIFAIALSAAVTVIFIYGLGILVPVWPG